MPVNEEQPQSSFGEPINREIGVGGTAGFHGDQSKHFAVDTFETRVVLAQFHRAKAARVWSHAQLSGNSLTYPEVQTLLDGIGIPKREGRDVEQVLRLRDAHDLLTKIVSSDSFEISHSLADEINDVLAIADAAPWESWQNEDGPAQPRRLPGDHGQRPTDDLRALTQPFERAVAVFLQTSLIPAYNKANAQTRLFMLNGALLSNGINAVLLPVQRHELFSELMTNFLHDTDATAVIDFLSACGPNTGRTTEELHRINSELGRP